MMNNVEGIKKLKEEKFSKIFDIEKSIFDRMLKLLRNMQNWNLMARYMCQVDTDIFIKEHLKIEKKYWNF